MPQFKAFRAQVDVGVLTVTLDDPPLNLIGPTFAEDLIALIQEAEASPAYRVVVFESAVANFFSAHVDLTRVPQLLEVIQQFLPGEFLGMLYRRLSTAPIVTIAKVAGRVRGAGHEFIWRAICASLPTSALSSAKWKPGLACFRAPEACNTLHGS